MKQIKVGSDFSGVGAFDQALRRLGIDYKTIFACDMDKYARQTYIENYGEPGYYPENVYQREIPGESLDIYMTSPPCQSFSLAGKRKGEHSVNGVLFYNSHEFIVKNKPRYFIFENVKGLLSDNKGRTFQTWIDMLGGKSVNGNPVLFPCENSTPYHVYHKVLNAKKYGVPQNRERVFIIGIRDDQDNKFTWPKEQILTKRLKDVLESEVDEKYYLGDNMLEHFATKEGAFGGMFKPKNGNDICACIPAVYHKMVIQLNNSKESGGKQPYQQNRIYDIEGVNPALMSGQENWGGNIINTTKIRRLTPRECFRLMDFPENFKWTVSDTQAYKQAGNSIVVNVLAEIIKKLQL